MHGSGAFPIVEGRSYGQSHASRVHPGIPGHHRRRVDLPRGRRPGGPTHGPTDGAGGRVSGQSRELVARLRPILLEGFLAVNAAASPMTRGLAVDGTAAKSGPAARTTWMTWKSIDDVFMPGGSPPSPWDDGGLAPPGGRFRSMRWRAWPRRRWAISICPAPRPISSSARSSPRIAPMPDSRSDSIAWPINTS